MKLIRALKEAGLVLAIASSVMLSACGGSSPAGTDTTLAPGDVGCLAGHDTVPDAGSGLNRVQDQIKNAYFPSGGGRAGSALLCTVSHVINVANDLLRGLQVANHTKDPNKLNPYVQNIGTQVYAAAGNLILVLTNLQNDLVNKLPAGQQQDFNTLLGKLIGTLRGVEAQLVNGYTNQDGSVNIDVATSAINKITSQVLSPLLGALGAFDNLPVLGKVVQGLGGLLNSTVLPDLSSLLNQLGTFNAQGVSSSISKLVDGIVNGLAGLTGTNGILNKLLVTSPLGGLLDTLLGPGGTLTGVLNALFEPGVGLVGGLLNTLLCPVLKACQNPNPPGPGPGF